jgi:predicted enzyme related to lactoylglutathione lyase
MVGWFEIPVADMKGAIAFYKRVFEIKLARNQMGQL